MVKVSVIVLNWNGRRWLYDCLPSILHQRFADGFEVLLIDNGSTDDSVDYVRKTFPQVKIVTLGSNYGFAEGNNRALKYAQGEYLVFVNTDTKAEDEWLSNLEGAADRLPQYSILCSIQTPAQETNRVRVLNAYGIPMSSPSESEYAITDSLFASGAAFLISRRWLDHVGYLFDPYYSAYAEDLELSLRTILVGGRIGYVRTSRIYHYIGGAGMPSSKASFLATRNILFTYYKLFESRNFVKILFVQLLYITGRFFARREQWWTTMGMIKGLLAFLSSFPRYNNYRREFSRRKKREDEYIFDRFLYRSKIEKLLLRRGIYAC